MGRLTNEGKQHEKVVAISTTIPISVYMECKNNAWKFNELIIMGTHAKKGMPNTLERVKELEEGNVKLQSKLTKLSEALWGLTKGETDGQKTMR